MTDFNVTMKKSPFLGWTAETEHTLNDMPADYTGKAGKRVLSLSTHKTDGGVITARASVSIHRKSATEGYTTRTFEVFGDFNKRLGQWKTRATEKNVIACHAEALKAFPAMIDAATAFYAARDAEKLAQAPAA